MVRLCMRFLVAVDQCVLLIRRSGPRLLAGLMLFGLTDSPEIWRMAWLSAVSVMVVSFIKVIIETGGVIDDRNGERSIL